MCGRKRLKCGGEKIKMKSEFYAVDFSDLDLDQEFLLPSHCFTNCMCKKISEVNYVRLEDRQIVLVRNPQDLLVFVRRKENV
jgi:hypothetical protein